MKIAYIGTYPPRQCGIGTFTQDLYHSMVGTLDRVNGAKKSFIIAMNDEKQRYSFPPEVRMTIRQECKSDYLSAAEYINNSGADVCMVQHEFGIFGGQSGVYLLSLLDKLVVPITVTLHTVLQSPTFMQRHIMYKMGEVADKIIVMSHKAVSFLLHIYDIPKEKIELIEHGVPDHRFNRTDVKAELGFKQKKVLLTFGLLSRNKGIETAIKALPALVKRHPEVVYVVLGKTHPNVLRSSGDEYRIALMELIKHLDLEKHVIMVDRFVSQEELFKYLYASDIYITPYLSKAQITSGTLSFAVGAGLAVVSTPYWHAEELLDHDRGRLFDFKRADQLRDILMELLDNPDIMSRIRNNAFNYGKEITWPKIGSKYNHLLRAIIENAPKKKSRRECLILISFHHFQWSMSSDLVIIRVFYSMLNLIFQILMRDIVWMIMPGLYSCV
ncbi:glycosyltransferase family 4 protein [Saccharicrinis fermentans]|uniref:D-inositol-3-phosphate glycosyltransferase n=1 Tax=Saccharicrinis fermentans DSM 9555 = JCM 21142 TaxID=869213 RepID=W7Y679_9BACT|nr:glycosyltransferase family 4 protein [Saccharicrinis fermentans]GAF03672.1 D-inositol-3-phosphate glycosyltransferase [Saccharicrinis fermentans DSM 9555 = JCM 21142]